MTRRAGCWSVWRHVASASCEAYVAQIRSGGGALLTGAPCQSALRPDNGWEVSPVSASGPTDYPVGTARSTCAAVFRFGLLRLRRPDLFERFVLGRE